MLRCIMISVRELVLLIGMEVVKIIGMGVVRSTGMADDFASLVIVIFMGTEERHDHDHDYHDNHDCPR